MCVNILFVLNDMAGLYEIFGFSEYVILGSLYLNIVQHHEESHKPSVKNRQSLRKGGRRK